MTLHNINFFYIQTLRRWFGENAKRRKFIDYVVSSLDEDWNRKNIFIIEAPTGYGKTTISASISMYSVNEELKAIVTLPLRSILEDQYRKFKSLTDLAGKRYMHNPDSRYLLKPITLTTLDTLSLTLFGLSPEDFDKVVKYWSGTLTGSLGHYLFSVSSATLSNIILDEVHLLIDSTKSLNFLIALMKLVIRNGQKLVVMSATIPTSFKKIIERSLAAYMDKILFLEFSDGKLVSVDDEFIAERLSKKYNVDIKGLREGEKYEFIERWIEERMEKYSRVIVVFNTVRDAVEFYRRIKIKDVPKLLLHSRFNEMDRERKIDELIKLKKMKKYIIISTQVVEAGVDISSNLLISELAPINSIVQRIGRFLRYEGEHEGKVLIWYEVDDDGDLKKSIIDNKDKYKVYSYDLTKRTLEKLLSALEEGRMNLHIPSLKNITGYRDIIDMVYLEGDLEISEGEVEKLLNITVNLESMPYEALEQLIRLEGSFVRESMLIPVIPQSLLKEEWIKNISKLIVPVSFEVFLRLVKHSLVREAISSMKEDEWGDGWSIIKLSEKDIKSMESFRKLMQLTSWRSIVAFIIDAEYSAEEGLIIGD
jgi:CRISPR-associated endonuclease/helicase Cas3